MRAWYRLQIVQTPHEVILIAINQIPIDSSDTELEMKDARYSIHECRKKSGLHDQNH